MFLYKYFKMLKKHLFQALLVSMKTEKEKGHEMSLEGDFRK